MIGWFRSHHGAPLDPKWILIARKAGVRPVDVAGISGPYWIMLANGPTEALWLSSMENTSRRFLILIPKPW